MSQKTDVNEADILFLHPPSSFNKSENPLSGVFPAEIGTNDYFLHPPLGIFALYHKLKSKGFSPGFVNVGRALSKAMECGENFVLENYVNEFKAQGIGIDLQWAVHTPGALDLAYFIKKIHPDCFIFFGGLTATYYYQELLRDYSFIDAVVLGEADEAIVDIAKELQGNKFHFKRVPNLAYRNGNDLIVNPIKNPISWKNTKFHNLENGQSIAFLSIKGCTLNCPFCGGSCFSYKNFFYRDHPISLSPKALIEQIEEFEINGAEIVFLVGDIRIMGTKYVNDFLARLRMKKFNIHIRQELYFPASLEYLNKWKEATSNCSFTFSPESADNKVLKRLGKGYSNKALWKLARCCSELEIPLTLCFMFALPEQDTNSIRATLDFIDEVTELPYIDFMIEPMLFIDPGSAIFEEPEKWGYQIDFKTIRDFKENLEKPHWMNSLGYHTQWLSKEEIIDAILYVAECASKICLKRGPKESVLYLTNVENVRANQKAITLIKKKFPCSDEEIRKIVEDIFPKYLLDNNLIRKDRNPQTDSVLYNIFPLLNYLLLQLMEMSPHRLLQHYQEWSKVLRPLPKYLSRDDFAAIKSAPESIKMDILNLTESFHLDPVFINNLIDYEWINSLSSFTISDIEPRNSINEFVPEEFGQLRLNLENTIVFKSFQYDFENVDLKSLQKGQSIYPKQTWYLYKLQVGTHFSIPHSIKQLLDLCDGTRSVEEILIEMKTTPGSKDIVNAMLLGLFNSRGILLKESS